MTGPQTLLPPVGDDGDPDVTHIDLAEAVYRHTVIAPAIASLTAPAPAAHQHRTPGLVTRIRGLFRGHDEVPAPPSLLLADRPGEFTAAIAAHKSPVPQSLNVMDRAPVYRYDSEVAQADQEDIPTSGFVPQDMPEGVVHYDSVEPARPFTPPAISAIPWAAWDTPANREPMRTPFARHVADELTHLPAFREALAMSTRNHAGQCLCGDEISGEEWGERMVRQGVHMLSVWDLSVIRMLAATAPAVPAAQRERAA
jgi:hypothetical protein